MKSENKQRVIYYTNELTDDFGGVGLNRPDLSPDYKYTYSPIGNFFSVLFYFLIATPLLWFICLFKGIKVKGKKKLRPLKKSGYYIYGNHSCWVDAFTPAVKIAWPKITHIVGYTDALTLPVVKRLLKPLGFLPITEKLSDLRRFNKASEQLIKHKHAIAIYPEAHTWPYYTGIRKFVPKSFRYPAKFSVPVVPFFSTYRKSKFSDKPKMTIHIGDPIYPDNTLSIDDNTTRFAQKTYEYMLNCSLTLPNYEYIKYVKKDADSEQAQNDN